MDPNLANHPRGKPLVRPKRQPIKAKNMHRYVPTFLKEVLAKSFLKKPNLYLKRLRAKEAAANRKRQLEDKKRALRRGQTFHAMPKSKAEAVHPIPISKVPSVTTSNSAKVKSPLSFDASFPWNGAPLTKYNNLLKFAEENPGGETPTGGTPAFVPVNKYDTHKPAAEDEPWPNHHVNNFPSWDKQNDVSQFDTFKKDLNHAHAGIDNVEPPPFPNPEDSSFRGESPPKWPGSNLNRFENFGSKSSLPFRGTARADDRRNHQQQPPQLTHTFCVCCDEAEAAAASNNFFSGDFAKRRRRSVLIEDPDQSSTIFRHRQHIHDSLTCENQDPVEVVLLFGNGYGDEEGEANEVTYNDYNDGGYRREPVNVDFDSRRKWRSTTPRPDEGWPGMGGAGYDPVKMHFLNVNRRINVSDTNDSADLEAVLLQLAKQREAEMAEDATSTMPSASVPQEEDIQNNLMRPMESQTHSVIMPSVVSSHDHGDHGGPVQENAASKVEDMEAPLRSSDSDAINNSRPSSLLRQPTQPVVNTLPGYNILRMLSSG